MQFKTYQLIYEHVINQLLSGLSVTLTYHNINHTLDMVSQVQRIANDEEITNEEELNLLKIAALYHDAGFLYKYTGHEEVGCVMARKDLTDFGLNDEQIERICGMIMATKIPQSPKNKIEEIICDADLDYLGRSDFLQIGDTLRKEFIYYKIVPNDEEWEKLQLKFLQNHKYHTNASQKQREPVKQQNYSKLIAE